MSEQIGGGERPLDQLFDALSHPYRRQVLTELHVRNPREVAAFARAVHPEDADAADRVQLEAYHRHLPKLAAADYVEWDREADVVRRGPAFDEVAPFIEAMIEHAGDLPAAWP